MNAFRIQTIFVFVTHKSPAGRPAVAEEKAGLA
jgi:hypothetical protein